MFCPQCATPMAGDQKFCRSCGFNLRQLQQLSAEETRGSGPAEIVAATTRPLKGKREKVRFVGLMTLLSSLLVGSVIPILAGLTFYTVDVAPLIPILAGLTGILLFGGIILLIVAESLPKTIEVNLGSDQQPALKVEDTKKLPPASAYGAIHSVTERTTDLLKSPVIDKEQFL
jgi:hypothetical protein